MNTEHPLRFGHGEDVVVGQDATTDLLEGIRVHVVHISNGLLAHLLHVPEIDGKRFMVRQHIYRFLEVHRFWVDIPPTLAGAVPILPIWAF